MKRVFEIPDPCHEDWNAMSRDEKGRFCGVCSKVVVDFTDHSNAEIADFLRASAGQRVCGRVRKEQPDSNSRRSSRYRIFLAAIYFVFGGMLFTSCNSDDSVVGKIESNYDTIHKHDSANELPVVKPAFDSAKYFDSIQKLHASQKLKRQKTLTDPVPPYDVGIMVMPPEQPQSPDTTKK